MPIVALGTKAYRRLDGLTPEVRLRNLYLEKDESGISPDGTLRVQRPGLTRYNDLTDVRGMDFYVSGNVRLTVAANQLYAGTDAKGFIAGAGIAPMVTTTFYEAILGGNTLYLYDGTLTKVSTPEGDVVQDIDQLNQYVLVLTPSGRFYWIVPGDKQIDALNFATAESSPDAAKAICRVGDEFWIFGDQTIEPWQSTGDPDAPFQRVSGRTYERGCLSRDTVKRFDNSVMWVSDDSQVCRGGAVPQVVSDNGIAERIRKRGGDLSAWVFGLDGHEFYVLRIPGQGTFAYDASTQNWSEFATLGSPEWAPLVGYDRAGLILCGGAKLWKLDSEAFTDDGVAIERTVTGTVALMGKIGRNDSFSIGVGASADATVRIRWRDGQDDYAAYYDEIPIYAPFDVASIYRLGMPQQPYREVEVSCLDPVRLRIAGCIANGAWK